MLLNLGLGLGGLISSTIVDLDDPDTFTLLYALTSLAYVAYFVAVLSMGNVGGLPPEDAARGRFSGRHPEQGDRRRMAGGPSRPDTPALRGRRPADAHIRLRQHRRRGLGVHHGLRGAAERYIGIVFAANTAVIVLSQLFVLSIVKGRSRARVLAGVGMLWAISWLLFGSALRVGGWLAVGALILAMAVFALGETMWSPTAPALLNDLAPEHLRGRYNAFQSVLWGVSGALGPLLTGAFLATEHGTLWTLTLATGCLFAALLALRLRSHLTPGQDGTGASEDAPDEDPDPARPDSDPDLDPSYSMDTH